MNTVFSIYNSDGRVIRTGGCAQSMVCIQALANEYMIPVEVDPRTHYIKVVNGVAEPEVRPVNTVTLNDSTLANVRVGATIVINGQSYIADSTDVLLTFSHVGTYEITVRDFPYLDKSFTKEVG